MANYFGTDGIRGEYGKNLTAKIAFSVGNALTQIKTNPKINKKEGKVRNFSLFLVIVFYIAWEIAPFEF